MYKALFIHNTSSFSLSLSLTVQPGITRPPSAIDIRSRSAMVTWDAWDNVTGLGDGPIVRYIIWYRERGNSLTYRRNVRGTTNTFNLTKLVPRTVYEVFVFCQRPGLDGIGQSSPVLIFSTVCPGVYVSFHPM